MPPRTRSQRQTASPIDSSSYVSASTHLEDQIRQVQQEIEALSPRVSQRPPRHSEPEPDPQEEPTGTVYTPILSPECPFPSEPDDLPTYFSKFFAGANPYIPPLGLVKNGKLPYCPHDVIGPALQQQAASASDNLKYAYKQYAEEWKVLNQSLVYGNVIAIALLQLETVAAHQHPTDRELQFSVRLLGSIVAGLVDDQLKRASTIIAAAKHDLSVANKITSSFAPQTYGVHPDAIKILQESSVKATTPKKFSSTWKKTDKPRQANGKSQANPATGTTGK